ncbi:hypothetical protein E2C01_084822 [Portunus trituberculatus]|uniref:Uncharacterized protein n=1 Tax=Portunus trituberculatus TaxID=210409 RepID=A0A5B7IZA6_PORTR|nr:hypothetical protein [Portunus trituberculatus]
MYMKVLMLLNILFVFLLKEEAAWVMKLRSNSDVSPRRREAASSKGKQRKAQHSANKPTPTVPAEHQEENQKFTFSKRGKVRGNKGNRDNQVVDTQSLTFTSNPRFRSYSWQSFRINKKEVMDAIDRVWSGVTLGW